MSVSYLLGKPVRWASWLCKRFDSSADWDPTGEKWQVTVHYWTAPINATNLSVSCYVWALLKYSPWTQKYLPTPKQQLPSLALKSKFLASDDTITFPQKLWWGGKKAAKQSCKCRSNAQESITKYPPWPQLTSSDLCWNNATVCSD